MSQAIDDIPDVFPTPYSMYLPACSWETYEHLLDDIERSGQRLRLTYLDGALEVKLPGDLHESIKTFVRVMLEAYLASIDAEYLPMGSTTWRRRAKLAGVEPDECYYIGNASKVGTGLGLDLNHDPPPDLAIEVEDTLSPLPKLSVYARLNVPEIWHINVDGSITILTLAGDHYDRAARSIQVPYFDDVLLAKFIAIRQNTTFVEALRAFRQTLSSVT